MKFCRTFAWLTVCIISVSQIAACGPPVGPDGSLQSDENLRILRGIAMLRDEYESAHRILKDRYLS